MHCSNILFIKAGAAVRRGLYWFAVIFCLFFMIAGYAESDLSLYQAKVPVKSESKSELTQASVGAFKQVLVKLTGSVDVLSIPAVKEMLPDAEKMVSTYRYLSLSSELSDDSNQLNVIMTFNKKGVVQFLDQIGQPIWSGKRPLTLIWVQQMPASNAELSGKAALVDSSVIHNDISAISQKFGLPILFPLNDLNDPSVLQLASAGDNDKIWQELYDRYGVDAVLFALVSENPITRQWSATWELHSTSGSFMWPDSAAQQKLLLDHGIGSMVKSISGRQASASQQSVSMIVSGVSDLVSYAGVRNYLSKLADVKNIKVTDMHDSSVWISVDLKSNVKAFTDELHRDHYLSRSDNKGLMLLSHGDVLSYTLSSSIDINSNVGEDNGHDAVEQSGAVVSALGVSSSSIDIEPVSDKGLY